jgi:hypothetical protein
LTVAVVIAIIVTLGIGAGFTWLILRHIPAGEDLFAATVAVPADDWGKEPTADDQRRLDALEAGVDPDNPDILYLPTPLVATYAELNIHSPILIPHITEIEYHQASYDWALQLNPLLTIVDAETVAEAGGTHHIPASEQPVGDQPMIGEAVSTWRLDSVGLELSSIDVGALAGTVVYAPVTGTIVKIRDYDLYGQIPDYEIHIQVDSHPEWDIVVLHTDNLLVKEGDPVIGGVTPIAHVRNIGEVIDNNLSNFTAGDDPGNHAHVQVNNALAPGYKGLDGAIDIFR